VTASAEGRAPGERIKMTVSERSARELVEGLTGWLAARLGDVEQAAGGRPDAVTGLTVHSARFSGSGGLSSTSVLFEAGWVSGGAERHGRYVARLAPETSAVPVFPRYDLATQFQVISQVAARSDVPVPAVRWYEPDERVLGSPFFVMDQVDGRVPLDNPPYVFTGWLLDATASQLSQLQRALSGDGIRVPIIERSLDWLAGHWPRDPGPDVLSWGDSRIGNIIYQGFEPAAVLDWEMAALGPRELDVSWFIFLHRFFQDIATFFDQPGLPGFLRRSDVQRCYQELTGYQLRDMDFYLTYAALRHAIVMARIKRRMIHFGEDQVPEDPDDYVMHRAALEELLAGTYRWD
jgi:aminoglycoside phosphotransferase (APT) family kinase protein